MHRHILTYANTQGHTQKDREFDKNTEKKGMNDVLNKGKRRKSNCM